MPSEQADLHSQLGATAQILCVLAWLGMGNIHYVWFMVVSGAACIQYSATQHNFCTV